MLKAHHTNEPFLSGAPGRAQLLRLRARQGEPLAERKGVYREIESEGSCRQKDISIYGIEHITTTVKTEHFLISH